MVHSHPEKSNRRENRECASSSTAKIMHIVCAKSNDIRKYVPMIRKHKNYDMERVDYLKYLFIAEKPSLMREVRACYKNHQNEVRSKVGDIVFIALAGHVCEQYKPDDYPEWEGKRWDEIRYPMIPTDWKIIGKTEEKDLLARIKNCMKACDGIIVGTDSDIEGYGIYWMLEHFLHLEKYKTLRFIEHSLTDKEILSSLLSMTDYHTDPVHTAATDAYLVRSRADWLFGMNCTRVMTVKKDTLLRIGRVKAATIGIVYENSMAIENFKSKTYYQIRADYGDFSSTLMSEDGGAATFDKPPDRHYPHEGIVRSKKSTRTYEHAPKLFDLTTLQAEAGRVYKYTPAHTMEIVQSLYEKHKVISYPRTQCCYVSTEKAQEFPMMLGHMSVFSDLGNIAATIKPEAMRTVQTDKMVVNDAAVAKESHDALLPTSVRPVLSKMTAEEKNICHMIYTRLLAQFLPKTAIDKTTLVIQHGEGMFGVSGRIIAEQGWRVLFSQAKDVIIPDLEEGDKVQAKSIEPAEKKTVPPKRLTQASLVHSMKNISNVIEDPELKKTLADSHGIGTSSTRANIIKEILDSGYVEDKKGGLYITKLGKFYVESLEGIDIISPVFAARLDLVMKKVQYQEMTYEEGYQYVLDKLQEVCRKMDAAEQGSWSGTDVACPKCGNHLSDRKYSYNCPKCGFKVNKDIAGKKIDEKVLKMLCTEGITPVYKFKRKNGDPFQARLKVAEGNEPEFSFSSGIICPACGKEEVRINRGGAFCDCGLKVFRKIAGHTLTDKELEKLLKRKKLTGISDFKSKEGTDFSADIIINGNETKLVYPKKKAG